MTSGPFHRRPDSPAFMGLEGRLAVVSNRLPLQLVEGADGPRVVPGSGGLVTAMNPVLREVKGLWVGWDGLEGDGDGREAFRRGAAGLTHDVLPVALDSELVEGYYRGFSNGTLWPLFHDLLDRARFSRQTWRAYRRANRLFADAVIGATEPGDTVWAHDYHLALLGGELRERAPGRRLLWFLHTPFPSPDLFRRLPWRRELIEGILAYDLVGFQTRRDLMNFLAAVRALVPDFTVRGPGGAALRQVVQKGRSSVAGYFPISIDFREFDSLARSEETARRAWEIHAELPRRQLILGIDRLDYTKGTRERLMALEVLLEEHRELHGKITLIQVAIPSRENVPEYQRMREELEREVARINGRFTVAGWIPIHYVYRSLTNVDLVAFYRTCEVALITPLRDGMNLVAKEYCAASVDQQGVLVLSEFAGAADQLAGPALVVNPYNRNEVADTLYRALTMPAEERANRLRRLRNRIRKNDVAHWAWDFSRAASLDREP